MKIQQILKFVLTVLLICFLSFNTGVSLAQNTWFKTMKKR